MKQMEELRLQKEHLLMQLDYERGQRNDAAAQAEDDQDEGALSDVSFKQTWPAGSASSGSGTSKTALGTSAKGGAGRAGGPAPAKSADQNALKEESAGAEAESSAKTGQEIKKRKEADTVKIPVLPKAPHISIVEARST